MSDRGVEAGGGDQSMRLRELLDELATYPTGAGVAAPDAEEVALCEEIQAIVQARRRARGAE
ncbi:hypothetical protein AA0Z99_05705 [Agrococcus sp. 1P02AA]|uniref:hypothetical protein n=1 Tax=Agrococcus sp. 1P02AA TaxID=3132259 RepID=UPI0039A61AEF